MKKLLTIFAFCFLLFGLSSVPARAEVTCPDGGFVYDPTLPEEWQCCNYQNSPNHIPADTQDCNSTHCQMQNFPKNANSNTYGGVCRYCNNNVTVRIDGCSGCGCTCNQVCAAGGPTPPPPPPEECPLPDYETDPCCPFNIVIDNDPSILERLASYILKATVVFKGDELRHSHVEELKLRHYGQEEGEEGAMRKLMPPNYSYIQSKDERQRVDKEQGAWGIKTAGGGDKVMGADPFFFQLNYATDFLGKALTPPVQESAQAFLNGSNEKLCDSDPISIDLADALAQLPDQEGGRGSVLAAEDEELCHEILPGPKHGACVAQDSVEIPLGEAVGGIFGPIKLFPSFSFLQNIFTRTLGSGTGGEPGGYFRIFDLPGETREEQDGEVEKGQFGLLFSLNLFGNSIPVWRKNVDEDLKGVWNTGTEAAADEGIKQKLTVPQAENGTTGYRAPTAPTTPSVVLTSTKTPLDSLPRTSHGAGSFAEKLGRTLGAWLGKLISL